MKSDSARSLTPWIAVMIALAPINLHAQEFGGGVGEDSLRERIDPRVIDGSQLNPEIRDRLEPVELGPSRQTILESPGLATSVAPKLWGPDEYPMAPETGPGGNPLDLERYAPSTQEKIRTCGKAVADFSSDTSSAKLTKFLSSCTADRDDASLKGVEHLIERTVAIRYRGQTAPHCSGLLLNSDTILTARHCVTGGQHELRRKLSSNWIRLKFKYRLNTESESGDWRSFVGIAAGGDPMRDAEHPESIASIDWIALKIKPVVMPKKEIPIAPRERAQEVSSDARLAIFGVSNFFNDIRWDDLPSCSIHEIDEHSGCFAHRCQTIWGASGSPIFHEHDGEWQILGIHLGSRGYISDCDLPPNRNEGIFIDDKINRLSGPLARNDGAGLRSSE